MFDSWYAAKEWTYKQVEWSAGKVRFLWTTCYAGKSSLVK